MEEDLKPLILIHGLLRTKYSMWYMGERLRKYGFQPYLFGYKSLKNPIATHSAELRDFIVENNLQDSPLYFLTHSLGSIVLRHLSIFNGDKFQLVRAVHLGPPHTGSRTARALMKVPLLGTLLGPSFRELANLNLPTLPDAPSVGVIAGKIKLNRGYYGVMTGENDGVVEISETLIDGVYCHKIIPGTHSLLPYNKAALEEAALFLLYGKFTS
jgi:triacylglycerol lipase